MGQAPKGRTQKPTCQLPHKLQQRQLPEEKKNKESMKPVTDQVPKLYTQNPTSQILHKTAAKTLTIIKPIMDQAPKVLHITQLS